MGMMVAYKHEQEVILYKVTFPVNPSNFAFSVVPLQSRRRAFLFTMKLQIFKINTKSGTERMGWRDAFSRSSVRKQC